MHDFLPEREAELRDWARRFSQKISADPQAFSLTQQQCDDFALLQASFAAALTRASEPDTNTSIARVAKRGAKKALKAEARRLARIIRAAPQVTPAQRSALGLGVPDAHLTPIHAPPTAPEVLIESVAGRTVKLRLKNQEEKTRRGKPRRSIGAAILVSVAAEGPTRASQWRIAGFATRSRTRVKFDEDVPAGATVWISACWLSPRLERGPCAMPIRTNLQGGPAAPDLMRLAA